MLNYQVATREALKQAGYTSSKVNPNVTATPAVNIACVVRTISGSAGTICFVVYLACILSACVPYAVDINFDQIAIDALSTSGAAGVGIVVAAATAAFPDLAPYIGIVGAVLAAEIIATANFAKNACGGAGAGIYIGFPSGFSIHC